MKREGRQHGMLQTYFPLPLNARPNPRKAKELHHLPTTAGIFVKVPNKPTNQSKFTSRCTGRPKCGGCHMSPPCKSNDKVKGTRRPGSSSVYDERPITWRAAGSLPSLRFSGCSGKSMLDYLAIEDSYIGDEDCTDTEES